MSIETGDQAFRVDPKTGTVEKDDRSKQAGELAEKPEDWREQK